MTRCSEDLVSRRDVFEHLRAAKFDLAISELFHFCAFGLFEAIGITKVGSLEEVQAQVVGASNVGLAMGPQFAQSDMTPSYIPGVNCFLISADPMTHFSDQMTFPQRIVNWACHFLSYGYNAIIRDVQVARRLLYVFRTSTTGPATRWTY